MKQYRRIILGPRSSFASECLEGGYIGIDYLPKQDLTGHLPEDWRAFNRHFIPIYQRDYGRSKVGAGLHCGLTWTLAKGLRMGDRVLSPDQEGLYHLGEVTGDYTYHPGTNLPHRRAVSWFSKTIERSEMSESLQASVRSGSRVVAIEGYAEELEGFLASESPAKIIATDESIEDPVVFALEKHLEEFLVRNWSQTELGKEYDIYELDGEIIGQQFQTDTGPMDILAISKDGKTLLVVELKKGRVSDRVIGQVQRYMGYALEELAEEGQHVRGAIIALEEDKRIRRALAVAPNIDFYRYEVSFSLKKV